MPLYHGTAWMATAIGLYGGIGVAVAPKFSVSNFWPDVHDSGATIFIYVGETARYLLNAAPHPLERDHKLRLAYGNGLRADVWSKMQERFGIPEVNEFFSSSEGVLGLNVHDRGPYLQGKVGHHGGVMRMLLHRKLVPVQIDHETGELWRDPTTGFARRMSYDEGGEILVQVPSRAVFGGYLNNQEATDKKFTTDVFVKGDLYYRSGDALRRTDDGHWYFLDRLGDTFRWKSENVSTAEVAEVLGRFPGVAEANVYGVGVPNHEGKAGCAAIRLDENVVADETSFDYGALLRHARRQLPKYAVPVFLRVTKATAHLHNHKQNKVPLRKEGVDPDLVGTLSGGQQGKDDVILWVPSSISDRYIEFKRVDWERLKAGRARL
jgi:acyl-CoA synthetase (AMP-forming)/AMP-acid ligase II